MIGGTPSGVAPGTYTVTVTVHDTDGEVDSDTAQITIYAANGSGTLTTPTSSVIASLTGNTITFTYTAPAGGMNNGSVTVAVPNGWNAPSTNTTDAGYTTATTGTVGVAGQTITVSGVTLAGGGTFTIVYGNKTSGGPGATAPSATGAQTWQAQQAIDQRRHTHQPRDVAEHHRPSEPHDHQRRPRRRQPEVPLHRCGWVGLERGHRHDLRGQQLPVRRAGYDVGYRRQSAVRMDERSVRREPRERLAVLRASHPGLADERGLPVRLYEHHPGSGARRSRPGKRGANAGKAEAGDTATITFGQPIDASTLLPDLDELGDPIEQRQRPDPKHHYERHAEQRDGYGLQHVQLHVDRCSAGTT